MRDVQTFCAAATRYEAALILLNAGARVGIFGDNGYTPLHYAAQSGGVNVVRLLLERGADKSAVDKSGNTPLALARKSEHAEVAELLL